MTAPGRTYALLSTLAVALVSLPEARGAAHRTNVPHAAATVSGVVYDSLGEQPLAEADVQLLREAGDGVYDVRTDSAGRFRIRNVRAGYYLAGFFHPQIDSLGLDLPPVRVSVAAEAQVEIALATPSRATILGAVCPDSSRREDSTLLLGVVRSAATGATLSNARVSVQWSSLAFQDSALATVRRGGVVNASEEGRFAVCNVPADAEFTVRAAVGADTSGAVALAFPPAGILARDVYVAPLVTDETRAVGRLSGRVTMVNGLPVVGARVSVFGWEFPTRTDSTGRFAFAQLPGGSTTLDVRGVGFEPVRQPLDLLTGATRSNEVSIVVARAPTMLAPVTVVDRRSDVLLRNGFEERRRAGSMGRFIDETQLQKMQLANTTSVLSQYPGMITRTTGRGTRLFMRDPTGRVCSPTVWVDGAQFSPAAESELDAAVDIDLLAAPNDIAGIEIYRRANQAPLRYAGTTRSACGVVVIWRKDGERRRP